MKGPISIQVETKMLLKIALATEFSVSDSELVGVCTLLRCSLQITLPLQRQTLPTPTHKGFWSIQSLERKRWKMPLVHQFRSRAHLPLAPYPWSRTVPRCNRSDGVPRAKSQSASWRVTLAGTTTSAPQNHVELKANSPLAILPKKVLCTKIWPPVSRKRQNTDNCVGLTPRKRKNLFASRVLHDEVSRSGRQKWERRCLLEGFGFFPMYRAESICWKGGKKGEGLTPSKVS